MAIRVGANDGLKHGPHHLKRERDQADLSEAQSVCFFQQWINGRDQCLDGIVEQMRKTERKQDGHDGGRGRDSDSGRGRDGFGLGHHNVAFWEIKNALLLVGAGRWKNAFDYFLSLRSRFSHRMARVFRPATTTMRTAAKALTFECTEAAHSFAIENVLLAVNTAETIQSRFVLSNNCSESAKNCAHTAEIFI